MSDTYFRPIPCCDPARPETALSISGGWCWFERVECLRRGRSPEIVSIADVPDNVLGRITGARSPLAGIGLDRPRLMGILNVTPDSFSDGGRHFERRDAITRAGQMADEVDFIDVGGESTRPGAAEVAETDEIARTAPVIAALHEAGLSSPVSIDTRKASVAKAALAAGARIVNDVSGLRHDPDLAPLVATSGAPVCIMHSVATPATMQDDPQYGDVLLDVYDFLAHQIARAEAAGIPRDRIVVDPGIGFGKTLDHNLALLSRISLFHALGCPILLGVSRKRFIGTIGGESDPVRRAPGSVAVALAAASQGVQILRIHDTSETAQALRLFLATMKGKDPEEE